MSLFTKIKNFFAVKTMDSSVPNSYPGTWFAGTSNVTAIDALRQSAVLQCVTVISNGIAQVPFRLMDKEHKPAEDDPLFYVFRDRPNRWQSSFDFWKLIGFHLALQGHIAIWVVRSRGIVQELIPFPPHRYMITYGYKNGWMVRTFLFFKDDGSTVEVPEEDVWELKWRDWDVRVGISQLDLVRRIVKIAIEGDKLSESTLSNGCRFSGILMSKQILQEAQYKKIREDWEAVYGGVANANKMPVLGADFSFQPVTQKNDEAQFIEQKKFQIEEICRAWNVNPLLVYYFDNATSYNNAEQMMVQHVVHTMSPWYRMIEESACSKLLSEEQRRKRGLYFAFNDAALMRTDSKTRAEFYRTLFNVGAITPNEIRALEDMPSMEGGDELYIQGAVVPLKDAGKWQGDGGSAAQPDDSNNNNNNEEDDDNNGNPENTEQ